MAHNRTVSGVHLGRLWGEAASLREEFQAVLALWEAGRIEPRIDAAYPFTEAAAAHRRILRRQNVGKVVLTP
jgi:NADPH:quinone reductase-like Zn-dependent oxidoreductase